MNEAQFDELLSVLRESEPAPWEAYVTAVGFLLTTLGLLAAFWQIRQIRQQIKFDHDKSRREFAIQLCLNWTQSCTPESFELIRFVDELSEENTAAIIANREFEVASETKEALGKIFGKNDAQEMYALDDQNGKIRVLAAGSQQIRYVTVEFLNGLESVFSAWRHAVADRAIIEEQFDPILDPAKGKNALGKFRKRIGVEHFPNIQAFVDHIDGKRKNATLRDEVA